MKLIPSVAVPLLDFFLSRYLISAGNDVLQGRDLWTCSYHDECGHTGRCNVTFSLLS